MNDFVIASKRIRSEYGMFLHKQNMSHGKYDDLGRKYSMWNLQDRKDLIEWLLHNEFKMDVISAWDQQGIRKAWFKKGMIEFNIDHESLTAFWSDGQQDYGSAIYQSQLDDLLIESLPYKEKIKAKKELQKLYFGKTNE